jgi:hypothetical protein
VYVVHRKFIHPADDFGSTTLSPSLEDIIFVASEPARARASLATFSCPSKISTNLKTKQTFSRIFFYKNQEMELDKLDNFSWVQFLVWKAF